VDVGFLNYLLFENILKYILEVGRIQTRLVEKKMPVYS